MNIQISSSNLRLEKVHHQMVDTILGGKLRQHLHTFNSDLTTAQVRIEERTRWGYKVNFSMTLPGKEQLYAASVHKNLATAVRMVKHKIERQLKSYKAKIGTDKTFYTPVKYSYSAVGID